MFQDGVCLFSLSYFQIVVGVTFIAFSSVIVQWFEHYRELIEFELYTIPVSMLFFGILGTLLGVIGFVSSYATKPALILAYSCMMTVFMVGELITGAAVLSYKENAKEIVSFNMKKLFVHYELLDSKSKSLVDNVQRNLKCCGIHSFEDWIPKSESNASEPILPPSCCHSTYLKVCRAYSEENKHLSPIRIFMEGCNDKVSREIDKYEPVILVTFVVLLLMQLCCIVSSFKISKKYLKKDNSSSITIIM